MVVIVETELTFAALELYWENGWSRNHHGVDSAAKAWDLELQEERALKSCQSVAQKRDFFFPRMTLLDFQVMGVSLSENAKDVMWS